MHRTIAILGAGFSGTIAAVHLLRQNLGNGLRIILLERSGTFGRGLAYGTWDDNLVLNVPAGNMSALADEPAHFVSYVQNIDPHFSAGSFVPRRIYGDYLADTLEQARLRSDSQLLCLSGEAIAVRRESLAGGFALELADGRKILADQVVLALGHFPPANPPATADLSRTQAYVANPWAEAALDHIDGARTVAVLGSGHTAVDTVFRLSSRNHLGKCFLISRRGLLPHAHRFSPRRPPAVSRPAHLPPAATATVRGYLKALRMEVRKRQAAGEDWRDVFNELRPHTPEIWAQLPARERQRFLDRVVPYWDIHRHRLAPSAHLRLHRLIAAGQVEVVAGRVDRIERRGGDVCVIIRQRLDGQTREITAGAVVNCTGPRYDLAVLESPLLRQLQGDGLLQRDPIGLGIHTDAQYQLMDDAGRSVPNLYYLGPLLKAQRWEAIAVPELRVHSQQLVRAMLAAIVMIAASHAHDLR